MYKEKSAYCFLYQLSLLEGHLVQEKTVHCIAYIHVTCGCSVLGGEYEPFSKVKQLSQDKFSLKVAGTCS